MSGQLQNGEQQFFDNNGKPLNSGTIDFYVPNTTTRKTTWQDQALTIQNTNPIVLDAGGKAIIWGSGSYRQVLKDNHGNLIWDQVVADPAASLAATTGASQVGADDGNGGSIFTTVAGFISSLKSSIGASLVGFVQAGAGAQPMTVQQALREARTNVLDFMTPAQRADVTGNFGTIDVSAAIQAAIDSASGPVRLPVGTYKLGSQLIVRNACTGLVGDGMYTTILNKAFNGNCISSVNNGAQLANFDIEGNGATFTGGGVLAQGYNTVIQQVRINGTADSPILFNAAIGTNVGSGTYSNVNDCFLVPFDLTNGFAIRSIGADDSDKPTCRVFSNISGGAPLVNFSGMNYVVLVDSLGTNVKFDANSSKIVMHGNRITATALATSITIFGRDHVIDGNLWTFAGGSNLSVDASCTNVTLGPNNPITVGGSFMSSPVVNANVGDSYPNNISTQLKPYTVGWYGTVLNPVIGNAVVGSFYKLEGRLCHATFSITTGTTTVVGTGTYTFDLPFKANVTTLGSSLLKSSSGTYYSCTAEVQGGSNKVVIWRNGDTSSFASTTMALSVGSIIEVSMTYLVQPT